LERPTIWPDVHFELIRAIRATLVPKVAPRYYLGVEERIYVLAVDPHTFVGRPDVAAIDLSHAPSLAPAGSSSAAVLERPMTVELPVPDRVRERYLEVRDATTHEVVTSIEVLSPTNKQTGEGRQQYERKRQQVLDSLTSLVEIDLLRAWEPMPMHPIPSSHYRLLVSRGWERPKAQLYPFNLNEPIPEIPIPLRAAEEEPTLALSALLTKVYDEVRYDLRIDYTAEPEPPLDPAVAAWSHELLQEAGRR
ncbi:MAG: DUF4058 family protein, partial [Anaerolineae bacterium]